MEIEEAINNFKSEYDDSRISGGDLIINLEDAKTILNYIENSIPKKAIEEKIDEIKNEKLNYSDDEYWLELEQQGYAINKLKELLEE